MGKNVSWHVLAFFETERVYKALLETLIPTCVCANESLKAVNFTNKKADSSQIGFKKRSLSI